MGMIKKLKTQLKTISTVASAALIVGCSCLPKDPDIRPKQILQRLGKCKQYTMEFGDKLTFKFEKDIPLSECLKDGYFVLTDEELVRARTYYNEAKKCYDQQCRGK